MDATRIPRRSVLGLPAAAAAMGLMSQTPSPVAVEGTELEERIRSRTPSEGALDRFRKWHVESLLSQAAELLDRANRDRAEYLELRARWRQLLIQKQEADLGMASLKKQLDAGMWDSELSRLTEEVRVRNVLQSMFESAFTSTAAYAKQVEDAPGDTPPHYQQAVAMISQADIARRLHTMDITLKTMQRTFEAASKVSRLEALANLQTINAARAALLEEGGPLYLPFRYGALEDRILLDVQHAIDRLVVADIGLAEFYNYFSASGSPRLPLRGGPELTSVLDRLIVWVRTAIRWLVAFGQLDQAWTTVFSLRERVGGEEAFRAAVSGSRTVTLSFTLPTDQFSTHAFVRLRGMALFAVGSGFSGPCSANVELPPSATVMHLTDDSLKPFDLDQRKLPRCYFGRVETHASARPPEVVGIVSVMNASPISATPDSPWTLTITSFAKDDFDRCEDFHLELNLLGRPTRGEK